MISLRAAPSPESRVEVRPPARMRLIGVLVSCYAKVSAEFDHFANYSDVEFVRAGSRIWYFLAASRIH